MKIQALTVAVWFVLACGLVLVIEAATWSPTVPKSSVPHLEIVRTRSERVRSVDSLVRLAIRRDVFRVGRRPATKPYQIIVPSDPNTPPPPARPALRLVGIVAGTDPSAILEGFPGIEGPRVVRAGDTVGNFVIEQINDEVVRISGMDTLWVLRLSSTWR